MHILVLLYYWKLFLVLLILNVGNLQWDSPSWCKNDVNSNAMAMEWFSMFRTGSSILVAATFPPSSQPTGQPSRQPSRQPTGQPSRQPTGQPSRQPTQQPTRQPTTQPSCQPTRQPISRPTSSPTILPTGQPTRIPTAQPSLQPFSLPTGQPTRQPTSQPSRQPTRAPSSKPSRQPSGQPSRQPSRQPTRQPTGQPSRQPTSQPSRQPTRQPTVQPTRQPTRRPTGQPSSQPTGQPTAQPNQTPSSQPTTQPSRQPTLQPTGIPTGSPSAPPTSAPSATPMASLAPLYALLTIFAPFTCILISGCLGEARESRVLARDAASAAAAEESPDESNLVAEILQELSSGRKSVALGAAMLLPQIMDDTVISELNKQKRGLVKESYREIISTLFCGIFTPHKNFIEKLLAELENSHLYFSVYLSRRIGKQRMLLGSKVLTCTSIATMLIFILFDFHMDANSNSCSKYHSESACLSSPSPFQYQTYLCSWKHSAIFDGYYCTYNETGNKYDYRSMWYIVLVTAVLLAPISAIIEVAFSEILDAPAIVGLNSSSIVDESMSEDEKALNLTRVSARVKQLQLQIQNYRHELDFAGDIEQLNNFDAQWGVYPTEEGEDEILFLDKIVVDVNKVLNHSHHTINYMGTASTEEKGLRLLFSFALDLMGMSSPTAAIFAKKADAHLHIRRPISFAVKTLTGALLVLMNVISAIIVVVLSIGHTLDWIVAVIIACSVYFATDILFIEGGKFFFIDVFLPQCISEQTTYAYHCMLNALDQMCDVDHKTAVVFSLTDYVYKSTHLARKFPDQLESAIIFSYRTAMPGLSGVNWRGEYNRTLFRLRTESMLLGIFSMSPNRLSTCAACIHSLLSGCIAIYARFPLPLLRFTVHILITLVIGGLIKLVEVLLEAVAVAIYGIAFFVILLLTVLLLYGSQGRKPVKVGTEPHANESIADDIDVGGPSEWLETEMKIATPAGPVSRSFPRSETNVQSTDSPYSDDISHDVDSSKISSPSYNSVSYSANDSPVQFTEKLSEIRSQESAFVSPLLPSAIIAASKKSVEKAGSDGSRPSRVSFAQPAAKAKIMAPSPLERELDLLEAKLAAVNKDSSSQRGMDEVSSSHASGTAAPSGAIMYDNRVANQPAAATKVSFSFTNPAMDSIALVKAEIDPSVSNSAVKESDAVNGAKANELLLLPGQLSKPRTKSEIRRMREELARLEAELSDDEGDVAPMRGVVAQSQVSSGTKVAVGGNALSPIEPTSSLDFIFQSPSSMTSDVPMKYGEFESVDEDSGDWDRVVVEHQHAGSTPRKRMSSPPPSLSGHENMRQVPASFKTQELFPSYAFSMSPTVQGDIGDERNHTDDILSDYENLQMFMKKSIGSFATDTANTENRAHSMSEGTVVEMESGNASLTTSKRPMRWDDKTSKGGFSQTDSMVAEVRTARNSVVGRFGRGGRGRSGGRSINRF